MVKVEPLSPANWQVELRAGEQPFEFPSKGQAIAFAIAWAEHHQPCEVGVFGRIGDLERKITLPDGNHRDAKMPDRRRVQITIPFPNRRHHDRRSGGFAGQPARSKDAPYGVAVPDRRQSRLFIPRKSCRIGLAGPHGSAQPDPFLRAVSRRKTAGVAGSVLVQRGLSAFTP